MLHDFVCSRSDDGDDAAHAYAPLWSLLATAGTRKDRTDALAYEVGRGHR